MSENQKQLIQLPPNDLQQLEQVSLAYDAIVRQGVKPEDVLVPGFWAHHAVKLRPFDEVRVRAEDGTWIARYVVLDCSRTWAKVQQLSFHRLTTGEVAETQAAGLAVQAFIEDHKIVHRGPRGWSVVRKGDNAVLSEDKATKQDASLELDRLARIQGAPPEPVTA